MLKNIYVLLLTLGAAASIIGNISYIAIILLIILDLLYKKQSRENILSIILITTYFLMLYLIASFSLSMEDLNLSNINIFIQLICLITFPRTYDFFKLIKKSLSLQILFSILLCLYGLLFNDYFMFIDSKYTKGYEDILIPKGIYSTPQALASVALIVFFLNKEKIPKFLGFVGTLISLNRTSYAIFILTLLIKANKKALMFFTIISLLAFILLFYNLEEYINLRTIDSRINLLLGASYQINIDNILSFVFGSWKKIEFYLPMYDIYKNYIENGYLFIFNFFGVIGIMIYLFFWGYIFSKLLRTKKMKLFSYF